MKPRFPYQETKDYITHIMLGDQRVIPSDTFSLDNDEYLLLEILQSTDKIIFLKIIGLKGANIGNIYLIPKDDFENKTLREIQRSLIAYQH